jgi:hypothetical protein
MLKMKHGSNPHPSWHCAKGTGRTVSGQNLNRFTALENLDDNVDMSKTGKILERL